MKNPFKLKLLQGRAIDSPRACWKERVRQAASRPGSLKRR
jgi:hypothetical protein